MKRVRGMMGMVGIGLCLAASPGLAQGSLTPPGAPAPAMKTLAQVEPRTPITNLPYTITQPGSYYLTTNLASTGNGIIIQASLVTIDLMGFSITGDRESGDYGIHLSGATNAALHDIVVRGGIVSGFGSGVRLEYAQNSRIEGLTISSNHVWGVILSGSSGQCNGNTIADCAISCSESGNIGVALYGTVSGQCNGNMVRDCTISGSGGLGVFLSGAGGQCDGNTVRDCTINGTFIFHSIWFYSDSGQCNGNTIANCAISCSGGDGINFNGDFGQCDRNTIANCAISRSGGDGIYLGCFSDGTCNGNTVRDCTISGNSTNGIYLSGDQGGIKGACDGNAITDCTISDNGKNGIKLVFSSGNTVEHCVLFKNNTYGIYLGNSYDNRIKNNHVSGTTGAASRGIFTSQSSANLILQNTCVGQTNNFDISASDTYGPIVTNTGELATSGAAAHPWANFSR